MHEVAVHARKAAVHALEQVLAHADQGRRSARCQVQAAQSSCRGDSTAIASRSSVSGPGAVR